MHNSFLVFDFGTNEEAAQQARQKLERWKQAFRLDKKLLYKFEREEPTADAVSASESAAAEEKPAPKSAKSKAKPAKKSAKGKTSGKNAKEEDDEAEDAAEPTGNTKLLVRLYFSGHEKLTYQRWIDRLPTEEPFKTAAPEIIHQGDAAFDEANTRFENLA
jgi:hypothetical protein